MPINPDQYAAPSLEDETPAAADTPVAAEAQPAPAAAPKADGPARFLPAIKAAGAQYGVDPRVLAGILYTESRFNPNAVGPETKAGRAKGIAQFTDDTAKTYGIDPMDPVQAIFGAAAHVRDSLDKHGGDYDKAIASYNWGRNRAQFANADWKSQAPAETQSYVDQVTQFASALKTGRADSGATLPPVGTKDTTGGQGRGSVNPPLADPSATATPTPDSFPVTGAAAIPGNEGLAPNGAAPRAPVAEPSLWDKIDAGAQAVASTATGLTSGAIGMAGGFIGAAAGAAATALRGGVQPQDGLEQGVSEGGEKLTLAPRTELGREYTEAVGKKMAEAIPLMAHTGEMAALHTASAPVARAIGDRGRAALARSTGAAEAPTAAPLSAAEQLQSVRPLAQKAAEAKVAADVQGQDAGAKMADVVGDKAATVEDAITAATDLTTRPGEDLAAHRDIAKIGEDAEKALESEKTAGEDAAQAASDAEVARVAKHDEAIVAHDELPPIETGELDKPVSTADTAPHDDLGLPTLDEPTVGTDVPVHELGDSATGASGSGAVDVGPLREAARQRAVDDGHTPDTANQHRVDGLFDRLNADRARQGAAPVVATAVEAPKGRADLTLAQRFIKAAYGKDTVFLKSDGERVLNGVHSTASPDHVFLDIDTKHPVLETLGHEMLHALAHDRPDIYSDLLTNTRDVIMKDPEYRDMLNKQRAERGLSPISEKTGIEELRAEISGSMHLDPKFIDALAQENPAGFRKIASTLISYLTDVVNKVKGHFGMEKYVSDIETARRHYIDAFKKYGEGERYMAEQRTAAEAPAENFSLSDDKKTPALRKILKNLTPAEHERITNRTADKLVEQMKAMPSANEMAAVAAAGSAKRGWYKGSAEAIANVFGPADAPRFAKLLSALSPQTGVEANLYNALSTWKNWTAAGRPTDKPTIHRIMGKSVQGDGTMRSVLPAWVNNAVTALSHEDPHGVQLSGPKVDSFAKNLLGDMNEVTNDAWMSNYAAVDQAIFAGSGIKLGDRKVAAKASGYLAMNARVREAANTLTKLTGEKWTPAEVQETIWSWAKTLYEMSARDGEPRSARELLNDGAVTDELINATPDFGTLFHNPTYAKILKDAGYGKELDKLTSAREGSAAAAGAESGAPGKARPFADDAQKRYEQQAARRLEQLQAERGDAKAATRERNAEAALEDARSEAEDNYSVADDERHQKNAQEDYDGELAFAHKVIAGERPIEEAPYYADYVSTIDAEAKLLEPGGSMLFVGSGPMPLSPILFARKGFDVRALDINPEAKTIGEAVAKKAGVDLPVDVGDATHHDFGGQKTIVLALEAGADQGLKNRILEQIRNTADADAQILLRGSKGDDFVSVKDLPAGFESVGKTDTWGGLGETVATRISRDAQQHQDAGVRAGAEQHAESATIDDFAKDKIGGLLAKKDWAILTAENPMGKQASVEENAAAMSALKADLDAMPGVSYKEISGKYGNDESSLAVIGVPEEQALALGKKYSQDSVLTRKGLQYGDGRLTPATGLELFNDRPDDYYSTILPNTHFAVKLDFDATHMPGEGAETQAKSQGASTPGFKKWFGDSKVVDENGNPLKVFHGTRAAFDEFDTSAARNISAADAQGLYFTAHAEDASNYAANPRSGDPTGANVRPQYVRLENPKIVDADSFEQSFISAEKRAALEAEGFDGVMTSDKSEIVAFHPEQVKSAIGSDPATGADSYSIATGPVTGPNGATTQRKKLSTPGARIADWASRVGTDLLEKVSPMSSGSDVARAVTKDYANADRLARWQWTQFDKILKKSYDTATLERMWNAADEENDIRAGRLPAAADKGLASLTADQRKTMDTLSTYGEELLERARDLGMFEGEGVPYWAPRMAAMIGDDGTWAQTAIGKDVTTSASSLKNRKYLTAAESEAAMAEHGGELVRNIRTMPLAMARLERALAGRELINQIKGYGDKLGIDLVNDVGGKDYFTIDRAAFKTWGPKFVTDPETGKTVAALDQFGEPIFERRQIHIHNDFRGPLKAIGYDRPGAIYQALMTLKGKSMGLIMYSPLIHNAVEWGRALPIAPGKVLTFSVYFEGNRAKNNPEVMRQAIKDGLVPIGDRGGVQDITGITEDPFQKPGRSLTAQALAWVPGKVSEKAGDAVKRGVDAAGDFWHGTLLWDRIADLQAGLYSHLKAANIKKGMDAETAGQLAAHWANRYAGALPNEAMSGAARKIANVTMFSRSFTLGNMGAIKDMVTGLPKDVQSQILMRSGELGLAAAKSAGRRKAIAAFVLDVALMYVSNDLLQDALEKMRKNKSWGDIGQGYLERLHDLKTRMHDDPMKVALSPIDSFESLLATSENEPGKKERVRIGTQQDGTAVYARFPVGKVGEDFKGWMTSPLETAKKKTSQFVKPLVQVWNNDNGIGHRIYDPEAKGLDGAIKNAGKIAMLIAKSQVPADAIEGVIDAATTDANPQKQFNVAGSPVSTSVAKFAAPLAGITVSKGAPGGPAVGELYSEQRKFMGEKNDIMPDVQKALNAGDREKAIQMMLDIKMAPPEIKSTLKRLEAPETRLNKAAMKRFGMRADDDAKQRMERTLERE